MNLCFFRTVLLSLAVSFFCIQLSAQRIVCDDNCKLADAPTLTSAASSAPAAESTPSSHPDPAYAVVSPVGRSSVEMIEQGARLETLEGKTIAVGMTAFLITGDAARNKVQTMPGGGYATIQIELPRIWDSLMSELGYAPLAVFRCR